MVQEIVELRDAVRDRASVDLVEIAADPTVTRDVLLRCVRCESDFERVLDAVLYDEWVPKTLPQLGASILRMTENLQKTQSDLDAALDRVLDDARPDSLFRVWMAANSERLLEAQRDILFNTAVKVMPEAKWIN